MARYLIHGNKYEVSDDIKGDQLTDTLNQLVTHSQQTNVQKFMDTLGKAEGAGYDTVVGGGKFSDFTKHPNVVGLRTKDGPSTAAGKYQITYQTYQEFAPKVGAKGFSPDDQDRIAQAIMEKEGALDFIKNGDFASGMARLGGRWASLPTSKYGQPKKTNEWFSKELGLNPSVPQTASTQQPYSSFGQVRQKVDPASLAKDSDWLRASRQLYSLRERRDFSGSDTELADWGKSFMGNFNFNTVDMARYAANLVQHGNQTDKEAFLFLMDTYDNTQFSWEGAGRAAKAIATDPTTYVGVGTLGVGAAGRVAASTAVKQGVKRLLLESLGRTGVVAAADGAILGGVDSSIREGVEVNAGRKDEFSLGRVATGAAAGAAGGLILGTAGDAAVAAITNVIRRNIPTKGLKPASEAPKAATKDIPPGKPNGAPEAPKAPEAAVPPVAPEKLQPQAPEKTPAQRIAETPEAAKDFAAEAQAAEAAAMKEAAGDTNRLPEGADRLTQAEIEAATKRGQAGRLWTDDLPPATPANPEAAAKIDVPDRNTGLRSTPRSMEELTKDGMHIADQLRDLNDTDMHGVLESFRSASMPLEDMRVVARGVQLHADELRIEQAALIKEFNLKGITEERQAAITTRLADLDKRLVPLSLADDAFGSMAGSMLRQRQEGLPGLNGVSIDSLMVEKGLTREAAEQTYVELVEAAKKTATIQKIEATYDTQIKASLQAGNLQEAARLTAMKVREMDALAEAKVPGSATFMQKANEFVISNIFSPTTVMVNLIPSAIKTMVVPLAKAVVSNPLEKATRVEMAAAYSAMVATSGQSLRAARAALRYEQSLLTRGSGRLLEGELAMKGRVAGAWRLLPRILNASDEFLAQVNYNGFVAGMAAGQAARKAAEKGTTGRELTKAIKEATEAALKDAFTQHEGEALIQPLVNKGVNLGLSGGELHEYVMRQAMRDPEALRAGANEAGIEFVQDVLYKRSFSGNGTRSWFAQRYEAAVNRVPAWKLIAGQLFFRTPVRVFEEGVRLTPGLQVLAPNFVSDLAGKNGNLRQARAQAEALGSLAVTGAVLSLYAQGKITGDGAYDNWRQQRTRTDGPAPAPYSIILSDGSTWSYRSFDPIATPFKIMVNGLERLDKLAIRQAQGELVDGTLFDQALAYVTTGTMAVAAALRDANLVAGLDGSIKFFENLADPEGKEGAWLKLMGEKLSMLVPNTLHKIAKDNDPTIKDPADFWQVVEARLASLKVDREDIKTSYSYDVLGNVRQLTDEGTLWNIFSTATPEERAKGRSEEALSVMTELDRLQKETGVIFSPPLKNKMLGEFDLRTTLTEDKTETLYDRWQRNYRDLKPDVILAPILAAPMPDGTFKNKAIRVETVQKVMNELREAAFLRTVAQEQRVLDELIRNEVTKAKAASGQLDFQLRTK